MRVQNELIEDFKLSFAGYNVNASLYSYNKIKNFDSNNLLLAPEAMVSFIPFL